MWVLANRFMEKERYILEEDTTFKVKLDCFAVETTNQMPHLTDKVWLQFHEILHMKWM